MFDLHCATQAAVAPLKRWIETFKCVLQGVSQTEQCQVRSSTCQCMFMCVCVHKERLAASCVEWDYVNMLICPQWRHSHQRLHAIVKRDRQWERKGGREGVEKMSGRAVKVWCAIWSSVTNRVNAERSFDGRVRTGLRMKMKKKACKWKQQDRWARWKVLRWFAWK